MLIDHAMMKTTNLKHHHILKVAFVFSGEILGRAASKSTKYRSREILLD
jgi:hypothetical protein